MVYLTLGTYLCWFMLIMLTYWAKAYLILYNEKHIPLLMASKDITLELNADKIKVNGYVSRSE
jgi:hypothetical protein